MDIRPPRPKKNCKLPKPKPLPIIYKENGEIYKFQGHFDGFTIKITDERDMRAIVSMGCFGKGSLSKSFPQFENSFKKPQIIRKRQLEHRKKLLKLCDEIKGMEKVIILPDSSSEDDDYFTNLQAIYDIDRSGVKETTNLMLEEAFFLKKAVGCLDIHYENKILDDDAAWKLFTQCDPSFQRNYSVFYFFRAKNWVVKSGLKFGGDYLLYKYGPQYYHASYLVVIKTEKDTINSVSMTGLQRLCENSGKELMICVVTFPKDNIEPDELSKVTIQTILKKRWDPAKERGDNQEQDDSESS